jgi:hypothetical protein
VYIYLPVTRIIALTILIQSKIPLTRTGLI